MIAKFHNKFGVYTHELDIDFLPPEKLILRRRALPAPGNHEEIKLPPSASYRLLKVDPGVAFYNQEM